MTETEFFGLINGSDETAGLNAAYSRFVKAVVELMHDGDTDGAKIALAYAENELQYHHTQYIAGVRSHTALFVRKALSFIRKMQKHIPSNRPQVPPLSIIRKTKCFDFWERNVLFPKTKRSFFRTPTPSTLPFSA